MVDCRTPHISLTLAEGFNAPLLDNIPRTKVAESADVTKNVMINIVAKPAIIVPRGSCSSIINNALVTSRCTASAR